MVFCVGGVAVGEAIYAGAKIGAFFGVAGVAIGALLGLAIGWLITDNKKDKES